MKTKSIVLSLFLVVMTVMSSYAQGFHIGIKGGANVNKIEGRSFNDQFNYGFSLGGFAELNFTKKWGIQPELLWNQSKTTTSSQFGDIYNSIGSIPNRDVTLNYLSIPLLLTYRPIPILSLVAGPQFGILMDQSQNIIVNGRNAFKKGDFSVMGGAQVNLGAFKAGARYFIGLNDINDLGNEDQWKNQGFQVYVGLRLF
ncbi:MAG TPA: porin family protein [Puia sp.]|nr:porin family protein [Puia sp.]